MEQHIEWCVFATLVWNKYFFGVGLGRLHDARRCCGNLLRILWGPTSQKKRASHRFAPKTVDIFPKTSPKQPPKHPQNWPTKTPNIGLNIVQVLKKTLGEPLAAARWSCQLSAGRKQQSSLRSHWRHWKPDGSWWFTGGLNHAIRDNFGDTPFSTNITYIMYVCCVYNICIICVYVYIYTVYVTCVLYKYSVLGMCHPTDCGNAELSNNILGMVWARQID
jgi:hypothetical protein